MENLRIVLYYMTQYPYGLTNLQYFKYFKKVFSKRAIQYEVIWLSSQTTKVRATMMPQFMIMYLYCAHMCILACQTMLSEEDFNFITRKNHFPFSECPKSRLCEASAKNMLQKCKNIFRKNNRTCSRYKSPIGYIRELSMHLSQKRQISADSDGNLKI